MCVLHPFICCCILIEYTFLDAQRCGRLTVRSEIKKITDDALIHLQMLHSAATRLPPTRNVLLHALLPRPETYFQAATSHFPPEQRKQQHSPNQSVRGSSNIYV